MLKKRGLHADAYCKRAASSSELFFDSRRACALWALWQAQRVALLAIKAMAVHTMMRPVPATTNHCELNISVSCIALDLPKFGASHKLMTPKFPSPFLTVKKAFNEFHHDGSVSVKKTTTALKKDVTKSIILSN